VTAAAVESAGERLIVENLSVALKRRERTIPLLSEVSLEVERGRVLGLIGESGSGKTMTCRSIVGALPHGAAIVSGEIRIGDSVLRSARVKVGRRRSFRVGMVFADPHASLDPLQRIGSQIVEMLRVHRRLRAEASKREALRLLEDVRLPDPERVYRQFPFELSGGMAQRAMIASILAGKPDFLLADEPTSALDSTVQFEILDLIKMLVQTESIGVLLTTHDMDVAGRTCESIGVMYAGRVAEIGPAQGILGDPQHPYSKLLLRARPRGTKESRLTAISGEPPAPGEITHGCPFAPRCPWAAAICRESTPPLVLHGDVMAACHFVGRLSELPE
jgi:oligopeptide/dipeptide ABC transporter ATP-binding protein